MQFTGTGVAIVTPFCNDLTVDYDALRRIVEHCITGEVDYIVVLGTTGETATLNANEKREIVRCVIDTVAGRVPVVMGIGGNNTVEVIDEVKNADFKDISGLLSVTPYYNRPTQAGLLAHFKAVAAVCPVPVIVYNVPPRTGVNMTAETTLTLAHEVENIVAVKEASGMISQMMKIIKERPANFSLISGDDAISLPLMAVGGQGVISVAANAFPREVATIIRTSQSNNYAEAQSTHYSVLNIFDALFIDGNPAGIKAALNILGLSQNVLRLPLVPATEKTYNLLKTLINQLKK